MVSGRAADSRQMDIFDQILENLELERDLGTRTVEIDRALLLPLPPKNALQASLPVSVGNKSAQKEDPLPESLKRGDSPVSSSPVAPEERSVSEATECDIAFFTGRPLSSAGEEAMEKTFAAIAKIKPGATLCINEERKAKVVVLLGSDALLKRLPAARPVRGAWVSVGGTPAVMTFSPDYIFSHFREGSPNMHKAKLEMWNDIKLAVARL